MARDLTAGSVLKNTFGFGLPLALGTATHALFNLVDLWMVGYLGKEAVAAIHLGSVVNFVPMIIANGLSVGSVALISRRFGAGNREGARELANRTLLGLIALGLFCGLIGYLGARHFVQFQNAEGKALVLGREERDRAERGIRHSQVR